MSEKEEDMASVAGSGALIEVRHDGLNSAGSVASMLREFHETYGVPVGSSPAFPDAARRKLRHDILAEEFMESVDADASDDLVEYADALGDMVYVIYGNALEHGIDLDAVLTEIHRANMSKLSADGRPIYRDDGKVLKGPNYRPPDIRSVLFPAEPLPSAPQRSEVGE